MNNTMEVAPRRKLVEKPEVKFADMVDVKVDEVNVESVKEGFFNNNNVVLIVIFAAIIIVLILVVVWLIGRNDRLYGWIRGATPAPAPVKKPSVHDDLVKVADKDELAMYASLGENKDEEDDEKDEKDDEKEEKKQEQKEKDNNDAMEKDLDAQLEALEKFSEAPSTSAISEAIDAEVRKMDAVQHRPIEQVSKKTHSVVKVFPTNESVSQSNYDIASVLACCRGEKTSYKSHVWRFQDDLAVEEPQD